MAISWMSFFWSCSTVMVFSILPVYLSEVLGIGHTKVGLIEGVAIGSSFAAKFFSGLLSDLHKKRKPLIFIGTILSALTKPFFAVCTGAPHMFFLRLIDRLSKGVRSAPTDALIGDLSGSHSLASNYGLRQALYTLGAATGAFLTMVLMLASDDNYHLVFWLSLAPAVLAIFVLHFFINPKAETHPRHAEKSPMGISLADMKKFDAAFWWLLVCIFFVMMARFSEAFVYLKAKETGLSTAMVPIIAIFMDLVHSLFALPAGRYADKISHSKIFSIGLMITVVSQFIIGYGDNYASIVIGVFLVGLQLGITQGVIRALIVASTPATLRGTAFSLYFGVSALAIFLGNIIAGHLSETYGMHVTFFGGAIFTAIALIILAIMPTQRKIINLTFEKI